jgi:hypothetical protein
MYICDHANSEHCKELYMSGIDWFECFCRTPHELTIDCLNENYCEGIYSKVKVKCIEIKEKII